MKILQVTTHMVQINTSRNHNTFSVTLPKVTTYRGKHYTVDWTSIKLQNNGTGYYATANYRKDK